MLGYNGIIKFDFDFFLVFFDLLFLLFFVGDCECVEEICDYEVCYFRDVYCKKYFEIFGDLVRW